MDKSYDSHGVELNKKTANVFLANAIKKWMDADRAGVNSMLVFGRREVNPYMGYVKDICNDREAVCQHYIYVCYSSNSDAHDLIGDIGDFMKEYDTTEPTPLPPNKYFGRDWNLTHQKATYDYYKGVNDAVLWMHLLTEKDIPTLRVHHGHYIGVSVRDSASPFPGNVQQLPFTITNIRDVEKRSTTNIKVNINEYLDAHIFEKVYVMFDIPIPKDEKQSVREWVYTVLDKFWEKVAEEGIGLVG